MVEAQDRFAASTSSTASTALRSDPGSHLLLDNIHWQRTAEQHGVVKFAYVELFTERILRLLA
jgi:hypothetical protein